MYFKSTNWINATGHRIAACEAPIEMDRDNPEILGTEVYIDGIRYQCVGVERTMKGGPIKPGEMIGVAVA